MTHVLTVNSGETYTVTSGTSETHARASIDGTLNIDGTLVLSGDEPIPEDEGFQAPFKIDFPAEIDLPTELDFRDMDVGTTLFLVGTLSITLAASWLLKNYAAGITWSLSFIALLIAGVFGMSLELFWMGLIATVCLLIVGMVLRWAA